MTPDQCQRNARLFHALSDPTRWELLDHLRHGDHCVCDLTGALEAGQSRLSFHLRALKDAGLVEDRREGRWVYYRLRPEAIAAYDQALKPLRRAMPVRAGRAPGCCR